MNGGQQKKTLMRGRTNFKHNFFCKHIGCQFFTESQQLGTRSRYHNPLCMFSYLLVRPLQSGCVILLLFIELVVFFLFLFLVLFLVLFPFLPISFPFFLVLTVSSRFFCFLLFTVYFLLFTIYSVINI